MCEQEHYPNGTCMNLLNEERHLEECEQDECEYKAVPILQDRHTQES